jgi:hypothetical protein
MAQYMVESMIQRNLYWHSPLLRGFDRQLT